MVYSFSYQLRNFLGNLNGKRPVYGKSGIFEVSCKGMLGKHDDLSKQVNKLKKNKKMIRDFNSALLFNNTICISLIFE